MKSEKADSVYKLKKRIKELEEQVVVLRRERNFFRKFTCEVRTAAIQTARDNKAVCPIWILTKISERAIEVTSY